MARTLFRLTVLGFAFASMATTARAADLIAAPVSPQLAYFAARALPFTVLDYEPGIYLRAYWSEPWGSRRYFPVTGKRPKIGRDENLTAPRHVGAPAKSFYRAWSTSQLNDEVVPASNNPPLLAPAPLPPQK